MNRIILNMFSKATGMIGKPIVINVCDFKDEKDAMKYAKFKSKQVSKEDYVVTITNI